MFQRRVASSCGIPRSMWQSLHIVSQRQASRVLPPLVPLLSRSLAVPAAGAALVSPGSALTASAAGDLLSSLAALSVAPSCLAQWLSTNALLLQVMSDTMCCTYMVVDHMPISPCLGPAFDSVSP